jgi:hypothetical protein
MIFFQSNKKNKRKKHKKRLVVRILNMLLLLIIGGIVYSFGVSTYENIQVDADIEAFKDRATSEVSVDFEYRDGVIQQRVYHIVPRETSYELNDTRSVFYDDDQKYLGQSGDIILTQDSPFPNVFGIHQFITYYFGGHAMFASDHNTFYEATGLAHSFEEVIDVITAPGDGDHGTKLTAQEKSTNIWLNPDYRDENDPDYEAYGSYYRPNFVGLRVKDITETQLDELNDFGDTLADEALYNYLFFLDMKYKYYCTDLISRAYQHVMAETEDQKNYSTVLNDDGFITSVNDLILSNDTYITTYVEIIDNVVHIYYLEDIV